MNVFLYQSRELLLGSSASFDGKKGAQAGSSIVNLLTEKAGRHISMWGLYIRAGLISSDRHCCILAIASVSAFAKGTILGAHTHFLH